MKPGRKSIRRASRRAIASRFDKPSGGNARELQDPTFRKSPYRYQTKFNVAPRAGRSSWRGATGTIQATAAATSASRTATVANAAGSVELTSDSNVESARVANAAPTRPTAMPLPVRINVRRRRSPVTCDRRHDGGAAPLAKRDNVAALYETAASAPDVTISLRPRTAAWET